MSTFTLKRSIFGSTGHAMNVLMMIFAVVTGTANQNCARKNMASSSGCYKARLEIKALCSNYTIRLLEGNLDTAKMVANWKDDATGKTYTNVFGLRNPCSFPASINAGDDFYFTIADTKEQCAVCLAYYPTPAKKLSIRVLDKPCN